jgi:hypothetical protein
LLRGGASLAKPCISPKGLAGVKVKGRRGELDMKIEIGESLMLSYLKHIKKCRFYQTNWKISSNWDIDENSNDKLLFVYDNIIKHSEFSEIFKQSKLEQLIKQSEIDVIGWDGNDKIYAADIAFHEAGLNYGSKIETKNRVFKKLLRSYLTLLAYFPDKKYELVFASPKVHNATEDTIKDYFKVLNNDFSKENVTFKYISNDIFRDEILIPVISETKIDSDTNELFIRAIKLSSLFEKSPPSPQALSAGSPCTSQCTILIRGINIPLYKDNNETIQDFVKKILHIMFDNKLLPEKEIVNMLDKNYCNKTFGITFSIIQYDKNKLVDGEGHSRYWSREIFGGKYYACSQWWKEKESIYREKLSNWIKWIGEINK